MNLKKKFVIGAASVALVAGMGVAPAMADPINLIGAATYDPSTHRIAGKTRIDTSIAAAKARLEGTDLSTATSIYLVGYNAQVDAATAGQISEDKGVVIYAPSDQSEDSMKLYALKLMAEKPTVGSVQLTAIGGKGVISDEALKVLKDTMGLTKTPNRIGGKDRYETAAKLAGNATFSNTGTDQNKRVYLANGQNFVDALGAGAIEDGAALLLIPPSGDIPQALQDAFKTIKTNATWADNAAQAKDVVVLGGEGAVPTAQVDKLLGVSSADVPTKQWEAAAMEAEAKKAVQLAYIKYHGQKAWEEGDPTKVEEGFGLGVNPYSGTPSGQSEDLVNDDALKGLSGGDQAKAFVGYAEGVSAYTDKTNGIEPKVNKGVALAKDALQRAFTAAKGTAKVSDLNSNGLAYAFQQLYGVPVTTAASPSTASDYLAGVFTFVDADPEDTDTSEANFVLDSMDLTKVPAPDVNAGVADPATGKTDGSDDTKNTYSLTKLAADTLAAAGLPSDDTIPSSSTNKVNYIKLQELVTANAKAATDLAANAKAELKTATDTYNAIKNAMSGIKTGNFTRVSGANRYETSAALNWYLYFFAPPATASYMSFADTKPVVYLASGEDSHLADSVVAGQLTGTTYGGPIMLVPTTGEINADVAANLAALGKRDNKPADTTVDDPVTADNVWGIGGTGAIADEVLGAAAKAVAGAE